MTGRRVVDVERALELVAGWSAARATVVLVRGSFDLLAAAEIRALAAARGDAAHVLALVRDDAGAARLLGPGRPVAGAEERARLVAALRGVDAVVIADDAAALALADALGAGTRVDLDASPAAPDVRARVLAVHGREAR